MGGGNNNIDPNPFHSPIWGGHVDINPLDSSLFTGAGTPWGPKGNSTPQATPESIQNINQQIQDINKQAQDYATNIKNSVSNIPLAGNTYNQGAQPRYLNNAAETAYRNSYLQGFSPNVNFNLNAETSPYKNISQSQVGPNGSALSSLLKR